MVLDGNGGYLDVSSSFQSAGYQLNASKGITLLAHVFVSAPLPAAGMPLFGIGTVPNPWDSQGGAPNSPPTNRLTVSINADASVQARSPTLLG